MPKTIAQKVHFRNRNIEEIFELYVDANKHAEATGAPAKIYPAEGSPFEAHNASISGKLFQVIANRLIVQSWRGSNWPEEELDSTLILRFEQQDEDAIIYMTHVNVPEQYVSSIENGWKQYYWKRWKKYLATNTPAIKEASRINLAG